MNADERLREIEAFADARIVTELAGGPTSDSYLVERGTDYFVLRIDTEVARALAFDRAAEARILQRVAKQGLGPRPEHSDAARGLLITRYVEGRAWTPAEVHDPERLRRLAGVLRQLHALEPAGPMLDLRGAITGYAQCIGTANARDLAADALRMLTELDEAALQRCLCHNDLVCANIIEATGLVLIDWEYAAIGDPMFDLAIIAGHHNFTDDEADGLLMAYFGNVQPETARRLAVYRALYERLVLLWSAAIRAVQARGER